MHLTPLLASLALALPALASTASPELGCYSTVPGLKDEAEYPFQSHGYCEQKCQKAGYRVAALSDGTTCACSNELPKDSDKVNSDECNVNCAGWPQANCGGSHAYTVLSTGEYAVSNDGSSTAAATGDIIVAPTNVDSSSVPTGILTAPGSGGYKPSSTLASTSAASSAEVTSVSTSASASPTFNAAEGLRARPSLLGAFVAGLGLLL